MAANKKTDRPAEKVKNVAPATAVPASKQAAPPDSGLLAAVYSEGIVWMLTIICSLVVYILVANVVHSMYHPDVDALKAEAGRILYDTNAVRPEPVESMLFRVGVVTILVSLLGFYRMFSGMKALKGASAKQIFTVLSFVCVAMLAAMIYADFAAQNPYVKDGGDIPQNSRDFIGKSNFDFFFDGIFLGNYLLLYTFILVPAIACLFLVGVKKYSWGSGKTTTTAVTVICGLVVLAVVAMNTFYFPYAYENKYDFNAVYYSMTQVYAGLPLLVNGFTNTYGLYPEFLNPLFHITGLSVLSFSLVMSLLLGTAFAFNFYTLKGLTSNRFILLAGFTTVVFFPYLDFKFVTAFDCIFALFPVRYIIPSTLALLCGMYFRKRTPALYWATFGIMGCFILWNPEIGMVCYLCWVAANTYFDFYDGNGKIAIKKILMHWGVAIGIVAAIVLIYKGLIAAIYGAAPDMGLLFTTITVFGKIGFNMLPMVLVHPWNISVVVLNVGFAYAISKWYRKQNDAKATMVLLLSLLGLGYFVYFQGRSHNWPFAYSTSFTIMLLAVLGDELWEKTRQANLLPLKAFFALFLFVISFSFFELLFGIGKINELVSQDDDKSKQADEQARIESNTDFLLKNSREKEKIYVFTAMQYQSLYFNGNKRISAFNPGFVDMFMKSDVGRLTETLADSSFDVFLEPALCNFGYMVRPLAAVGATYDVKAVNQTMAMLSKRTVKLPTATFFGNAADMVAHEKYTDDTAGVHARINDVLGTKPIAATPTFSAEVLFRSQTQVYPYATVMGNMNDSAGFIIANVVNTPNYFFGINGKGVGLALPKDEWVYCVMNVYPDHAEVFLNGNAAGSTPLAAPMRQSPEKLCVGNLGYMRYYIGPIAEVAVLNRTLDKNEIAATWEQIKNATGSK